VSNKKVLFLIKIGIKNILSLILINVFDQIASKLIKEYDLKHAPTFNDR